MHNDETIPTPEAGALLQISRVSGNAILFGSEFTHQHFVRLRIAPARTMRSLSNTWYMGTLKPYIEIDMSSSQFAEAITTMNIGSGIPCTMRQLEGRSFPPIALTQERATFDSEISSVVADCLGAINQAQSALDSANLTAKARQSIQAGITAAHCKLSDSLPFIEGQYKERLDGLEQVAKTEIAAFIDHAVSQTGIQALAQVNTGLAISAAVDK